MRSNAFCKNRTIDVIMRWRPGNIKEPKKKHLTLKLKHITLQVICPWDLTIHACSVTYLRDLGTYV